LGGGGLIRCGYACLTLGVPGTTYRTCKADLASPDRLRELIANNLAALENALHYNQRMGITLFRITSDLIPFGSSPVNQLDWAAEFGDTFTRIGEYIRSNGLRVSMHPGQYTVLNSPNPDIVARAIADLAYHARILDALGLNQSHKVILHVGGHYQDKVTAVERFASNWNALPGPIKTRLVIENDDKIYTAAEVCELGERLGIPFVFDNLHHQLNHENDSPPDKVWIERAKALWTSADGPQKIHYSQPDPDKKGGSHSSTIRLNKFIAYLAEIEPSDLDIMLEVKDKNLSAVKCQLALLPAPRRSALEQEWARYKYFVLEHAPADYQAIRTLLNGRDTVPVTEFYDLVEHAAAQEVLPGHAENAAMHVWGYFRDLATEQEKNIFFRLLSKFLAGQGSLPALKNQLNRLAMRYQESYLLQSLYFYI